MHPCAVLVSLHLTLLLYPFTSGQVSFEPRCSGDKQYNDCGCTITCSSYLQYREQGGCRNCMEGCFCRDDYVEYEGKCILPEECPEPKYVEPTGYPSPSTGYPSPSTSYPSPSTGYPSPSTGYPSPSTGYPSPSTGYPSPSTGYPSPSTGYPSPSTNPTEETYPVYPYPSEGYPYDPYEPYDPYDPYPFQYCELNEDEYGRPYYGAYDRYVSRNSYPPRLPEGYPTAPPTSDYPTRPPPYSTSPPGYPTSAPPGYPPSYRPYRPSLPPPETYEVNLTRITRKRRQVMTLPSCIANNECYQQAGT